MALDVFVKALPPADDGLRVPYGVRKPWNAPRVPWEKRRISAIPAFSCLDSKQSVS